MAREDTRTGDERSTEMAERVRTLRRARSLSIRELARRSEVSPDALVKLEHGARPARPSTVRKVAGALGVEPEYLRDGTVSAVTGAARSERAEEMFLALAARGRADAEGRDALEVYRELRENPPSLEEILGGAVPLDEALERARGADAAQAGLEGGPRLAAGEGLSDEVIAQRDARYN